MYKAITNDIAIGGDADDIRGHFERAGRKLYLEERCRAEY